MLQLVGKVICWMNLIVIKIKNNNIEANDDTDRHTSVKEFKT